MYKFVAIFNNCNTKESNSFTDYILSTLKSHKQQLITVQQSNELSIFLEPKNGEMPNHHIISNDGGAIIGDIFTPKPNYDDCHISKPPPKILPQDESRNIISTDGNRLRDNYWGSFVAFIFNDSNRSLVVFRSPLGHIPCYHYNIKGVSIFFSDASLLSLLRDQKPEIDWTRTAFLIPFLNQGSEHTPLRGLRLIRHGHFCKITPNSQQYVRHWEPAEICLEQEINGLRPVVRRELSQRLHNLAFSCVGTWASAYPHSLLALSEGFDSSLLAGLMGNLHPRPHLICVTACEKAAQSDTVAFARRTAERAKFPHIALEQDPGAADTDLFMNCPLLPWPILIYPDREAEKKEAEIAATHGLTARWRGDGGDELLGRFESNLAAIDYAFDHMPSPRYIQVAMNSAMVSDRTLWSALFDMSKTKLFRNSSLDKKINISDEIKWGLNREVFEELLSIKNMTEHNDSNLSPGSIKRLRSIVSEHDYFDINPKIPFLEPVRPFYSQPFVEFCLKIPLYVLQFNGQERGLARTTFAPYLTDEVRLSTYKKCGSFSENKLIHNNISFLTEFLLNGTLVERKILDKNQIEKVFFDPSSASTAKYTRLLVAAGVEAWTRSWLNL